MVLKQTEENSVEQKNNTRSLNWALKIYTCPVYF
jgi:hypothetical protein